MRYESLEKVQFEPAGEVLQVQGVLIHPGTFTGLDGKPVTFTKEAIEEIAENIDGNVPLKITHFSDKIIGYATHFSLDDKTSELKFKGYVFDEDAIEKIRNDGYDNISGEFDVDVDGDGKVVGGVLKAIAFVTNPAVPDAHIEEAKSVALSKGGDDMGEEVEMAKDERPTKDEFLAYIEGKLVEAGLGKEAIQKVMKVLKDAIKVPYPYPYPQPAAMSEGEVTDIKEYEKKLSEYETEIERLSKELEEYKTKFAEIKEKELKTLVDELKKLGLSNPEAIVEGIENVEQKIAILQRIKENLALSRPAEEESVKVVAEEEDETKALAKAFGLNEEEVKEIFG